MDMTALLERHIERVPESGCWIWLGRVCPAGQGRVLFQGKNTTAHRVSYFAHFGVMPEKKLFHLCEVPCCVNPHHLVVGATGKKSKGTRAYTAWAGLNERCRSRPRYAGRGIAVCERWRTYANFLADMGQPGPGLSLDRINNNGNYEPENCRWATPAVQAGNKSTTRVFTFNGRTQHMSDWCRELGVNTTFLYYRIVKAGWSVERAFTVPPKGRHAQWK